MSKVKNIFGRVVLTVDEVKDLEERAFQRGKELGRSYAEYDLKDATKTIAEFEDRVEELDDENKRAAAKSAREIKNLKQEIKILESDREDVAKVYKEKLLVEDMQTRVGAQKEILDKQEKELTARETKLGTEEDKRYKEGYADGVADGVRKVNEITQKDRDNSMKVAMVAAASHTPIENMKEINRELRLTEGTQDSEGQ